MSWITLIVGVIIGVVGVIIFDAIFDYDDDEICEECRKANRIATEDLRRRYQR